VTCTAPTLATGTTAPVITVVVTAPLHGALLSNTGTVTSATPDPVPANNTSTVTTAVGSVADLSLVKTGPKHVTAGANITYHLVVSNAGPDAAALVTVTDTLPPGVTFVSATGSGWTCTHNGNITVTCTRASLASGASAPVITLVVKAPAVPTSLANHANVTSTTFDPQPSNNSSAVPTVILPVTIGGGGNPLPHTGADGLLAGPLGVITLLLGIGLVMAARRRSS
jgi:large repetitive protein